MSLNNSQSKRNTPDPPKERLAAARDFSYFIGQAESVKRLRAFGDLYKSKGAAPEHILITGADGSGKVRLAEAFARSYSSCGLEVSSDLLRKKGGLSAELTVLDPNAALIIRAVHLLRRPLCEMLQVALQDCRIDLTINTAGRVHPYPLNRFTCIATAPRLADVAPDLAKCFALSVELRPYQSSELEAIAESLAKENGLQLFDGVPRLLANISEGNPGRLEQIIKRFSRLGKTTILVSEAREMLTAFGLNPGASSGTARAGDLNALSGVEFEKLITALLQRMGFQAEMTRATGDGGIDIVARLDAPITGGRYLVQCKRFADTTIGAPMIREFYGAIVSDRKAIKGIFITTSSFSDQARDFAQNLPIELIDGDRLRRLLVENTRNGSFIPNE